MIRVNGTQKTSGLKHKPKYPIVSKYFPVAKKTRNRFNGMSEEEVMKLTLPEYLKEGLDIVFVGINPGLTSAFKGHYYSGPGNHFWKCLNLSGLIDEEVGYSDDWRMLSYGIGMTDIVSRATRGSNDLTKSELIEGGKLLKEKLKKYRPKVVVFNGKTGYEMFSGKKKSHFGKQKERVEGTNTFMWVMPSSSPRCAHLPRTSDKLPFFTALSKFCKVLNGKEKGTICEKDFIFSDLKLPGNTTNKQQEY